MISRLIVVRVPVEAPDHVITPSPASARLTWSGKLLMSIGFVMYPSKPA
ncbi:MAG: hypothetical protein ACREL3_06700 [Gemmatimonadales bacterium]